MEPRTIRIRAAIFDVYGTLLQVGPPPADAEPRWHDLWRATFHTPPRLGRLEFSVACNQAILRQHAQAQSQGILHPEVQWPMIVAEILPEFARLNPSAQGDFLFRQIQTGRTTRLAPDAVTTLQILRQAHCQLGIASNAQAYTLRELREALAGNGLGFGLFDPPLCFWSFEHGFSKPNPHVFRILTARLQARGIAPAETLMVGDRLDNDIEPAQAHGWRVWLLREDPNQTTGGGWTRLQSWLDYALRTPLL